MPVFSASPLRFDSYHRWYSRQDSTCILHRDQRADHGMSPERKSTHAHAQHTCFLPASSAVQRLVQVTLRPNHFLWCKSLQWCREMAHRCATYVCFACLWRLSEIPADSFQSEHGRHARQAPPPPCSATSIGTAMSSCEGCPGYHGHAWPITCPRSRGRLTQRRVPNPLARRHSPFHLPFGPSVHHLLHPLSLAAGLPPPSPLALLTPSRHSVLPVLWCLPFSLPPIPPPFLPVVGHGYGHLACLPPRLYLVVVSQP